MPRESANTTIMPEKFRAHAEDLVISSTQLLLVMSALGNLPTHLTYKHHQVVHVCFKSDECVVYAPLCIVDHSAQGIFQCIEFGMITYYWSRSGAGYG